MSQILCWKNMCIMNVSTLSIVITFFNVCLMFYINSYNTLKSHIFLLFTDMKKSKSFTSAIKRRFGRNKKPRSHSADRAQSSSFREGSLLKPPDHPDINQGARTDGKLCVIIYKQVVYLRSLVVW